MDGQFLLSSNLQKDIVRLSSPEFNPKQLENDNSLTYSQRQRQQSQRLQRSADVDLNNNNNLVSVEEVDDPLEHTGKKEDSE